MSMQVALVVDGVAAGLEHHVDAVGVVQFDQFAWVDKRLAADWALQWAVVRFGHIAAAVPCWGQFRLRAHIGAAVVTNGWARGVIDYLAAGIEELFDAAVDGAQAAAGALVEAVQRPRQRWLLTWGEWDQVVGKAGVGGAVAWVKLQAEADAGGSFVQADVGGCLLRAVALEIAAAAGVEGGQQVVAVGQQRLVQQGSAGVFCVLRCCPPFKRGLYLLVEAEGA